MAAYFSQGGLPNYRAIPQVVKLPDGDRLVVHDDEPSKWIEGDRIAILFHGLCGSYRSPYMCRTASKLRRNGIRVMRVDSRGFGASTLISRSHVHAGCSQDVKSIVEFAHRESSLSQISLVGFSLGGNMVLKALGEWGLDFPRYVDSAIAISPPVNLAMVCANLLRGGNRIYDQYFMRQLRSCLTFRRSRVANLVDNGLCPIPNKLVHFDDQFTAPVWGFSGAREYYEKSSSGPLLENVQVPTILVATKDDPLVPIHMYDQFPMSAYIERVTTQHGGHLGYVGHHPGDPDRFWLDWRICRWISSLEEV